MSQTRLSSAAGPGIAVAGMLLIAATYGMARFGVGLFAPALAAVRPELVGALGWGAAAQFTSYSLAAFAAARLVDRHPRTGLLLAGATATAGCIGVAVATEPLMFVLAVLIGGMGGGFASPALVPVIDAVTDPGSAGTAQSVANAGTAVGVIGAGGIAFAAPSVGFAWLLMALICAAAAAAAWYPVRHPAALSGARRPAARSPGAASWKLLGIPSAAAVVVGAGSALAWTFGPLLVSQGGAVAGGQVGWLWIVLGAGGLFGTLTGKLVNRIGLRAGWVLCAGSLAVATAAVGLSAVTGNPWAAYAGLAVFGAGYMGMSAVLILWARSVWPYHAGAGTSMLFIALATGQAAGSAGFGVALDLWGPALPAALAAALCAAGGLAGLARRSP
ncbi:MFS transporter [Arthrobacter sp. zg-Y411]|uniref:MFS transporter n=1 Tax=Arthrobacter zhangbolii TaxID=2886936 RepID=UPI001D159B2D|nr:MFS transporter [Arthrobacter zhangbolii]MCC3294388.1 MFS transporter [Arthrobacter zhangbolii]